MRGWTRGFITNEGMQASRQQIIQRVCLMPFSCLDVLVSDPMPRSIDV
jgi:hypothetical protein